MSKKAIFQGTVEKVSTRSDRTMAIHIGSQEMSNEDKAKLMSFHQDLCEILLSSHGITEKEIEESGKDIDILSATNPKTPSQRLRSCLFLLWKQNPKGYQNIDSFYKDEMEKIINNVKSKLD